MEGCLVEVAPDDRELMVSMNLETVEHCAHGLVELMHDAYLETGHGPLGSPALPTDVP